MNKNSLKNLKLFTPGVSGNPGGRPQIPEELRAIHSLTPAEVIKLISKYARMQFSELEALLAEKTLPALELALASIFVKSVKTGDFARISFLLDRSIGKAPQGVEDDETKREREELAKLSLSQLVALIQNHLPPEAS